MPRHRATIAIFHRRLRKRTADQIASCSFPSPAPRRRRNRARHVASPGPGLRAGLERRELRVAPLPFGWLDARRLAGTFPNLKALVTRDSVSSNHVFLDIHSSKLRHRTFSAESTSSPPTKLPQSPHTFRISASQLLTHQQQLRISSPRRQGCVYPASHARLSLADPSPRPLFSTTSCRLLHLLCARGYRTSRPPCRR